MSLKRVQKGVSKYGYPNNLSTQSAQDHGYAKLKQSTRKCVQDEYAFTTLHWFDTNKHCSGTETERWWYPFHEKQNKRRHSTSDACSKTLALEGVQCTGSSKIWQEETNILPATILKRASQDKPSNLRNRWHLLFPHVLLSWSNLRFTQKYDASTPTRQWKLQLQGACTKYRTRLPAHLNLDRKRIEHHSDPCILKQFKKFSCYHSM